MINGLEFKKLCDIVFEEHPLYPYPGYTKNIVESPNGDGKWDEKQYAHIAKKYLEKYDSVNTVLPLPTKKVLEDTFKIFVNKSIEVAIELGVPMEYVPSYDYSCLRILKYPPGSFSHSHTDFDLFTLVCYRNIEENFKYSNKHEDDHLLSVGNLQNKNIHFGELLEVINPNFKATEHLVQPDKYNRTQYSAVFFAIPDHEAILPTGQKVGDWIEERIQRSRKY